MHYFSGLALSEIVGITEDVFSSTEKSPVFVLKDLVKMYKEILLDLGANVEFIRKVHSAILKESIMKHVSCLYEKKKGKDVLVTLEEHVGHAIFEVSKTSSFDEGIILSAAAKIIRHHLFSPDQVFDGDLSQQKQTASVSRKLIHLVSLILEGTSQHQQVSENTHAIAVNLSQLIRFNAVKTKRKLGDSHFRHSKANEPILPIKTDLMIHSQRRKKSIVND